MKFTGSIAIIGAGIGGLALAGFLARRGVGLTVFEQASEFRRLGAGIQMSPNAVRVLRALGLEPLLRARAFCPRSWSNRVADTGARTSRIQLTSRQNNWGKHAVDPAWVYGYDVWETPLLPPRADA